MDTMQTLSATHIKARIKSKAAFRRANDIIGTLADTSSEVTNFFKEKVDWYKELRILWIQYDKAARGKVVNSWIPTPYDSRTAELFYELETLFPDVIEITRPTEDEVKITYEVTN